MVASLHCCGMFYSTQTWAMYWCSTLVQRYPPALASLWGFCHCQETCCSSWSRLLTKPPGQSGLAEVLNLRVFSQFFLLLTMCMSFTFRMVWSAWEHWFSSMLKCSAHLSRILFWSFMTLSPSAVLRGMMLCYVGLKIHLNCKCFISICEGLDFLCLFCPPLVLYGPQSPMHILSSFLP